MPGAEGSSARASAGKMPVIIEWRWLAGYSCCIGGGLGAWSPLFECGIPSSSVRRCAHRAHPGLLPRRLSRCSHFIWRKRHVQVWINLRGGSSAGRLGRSCHRWRHTHTSTSEATRHHFEAWDDECKTDITNSFHGNLPPSVLRPR